MDCKKYEQGPGRRPTDGGVYEVIDNTWYCCICKWWCLGNHVQGKDHLRYLRWYLEDPDNFFAHSMEPPPHLGQQGDALPQAALSWQPPPPPLPPPHPGQAAAPSSPPPLPTGVPPRDVLFQNLGTMTDIAPAPEPGHADQRNIEDRLGSIEERLTVLLGSLSIEDRLGSIENRLGSIEDLTARLGSSIEDHLRAQRDTRIVDGLMARQDDLLDQLGSVEERSMARLVQLGEVVNGIGRLTQDIAKAVTDIHGVLERWCW